MADEQLSPVPMRMSTPWMGPSWGMWNLHQGMNGQLSAGVNVGFGKNNPWRGASFFTSMAGLYALPVSKNGRWTGAVGGYYTNYRLYGQQVNSVGLMGLVDYQINDKMSATGFVMHDFGLVGNHGPLASPLMMGLENPSTTFGAALNMKLSEKVNMSVGVSVNTRPQTLMMIPDEMMPPPTDHTHRGGR